MLTIWDLDYIPQPELSKSQLMIITVGWSVSRLIFSYDGMSLRLDMSSAVLRGITRLTRSKLARLTSYTNNSSLFRNTNIQYSVQNYHQRWYPSTMTNVKKTLYKFFDEKKLPEVVWTIQGLDGIDHIISNLVVIEHIFCTSDDEQKQILTTLMKIDFMAGDVNHFLKHLAGALVASY